MPVSASLTQQSATLQAGCCRNSDGVRSHDSGLIDDLVCTFACTRQSPSASLTLRFKASSTYRYGHQGISRMSGPSGLVFSADARSAAPSAVSQ